MEVAKLAWLAGIVDGEGCITMFYHREKNGKGKYCPTVSIVNNDVTIINEAIKITRGLGANFHVQERRQTNPKWNNGFALITRNMDYIKVTLEAILPYLIGKRDKAGLLLEYVNKRITSGKHTPYDPLAEDYLKAIKQMGRQSPECSTTKCQMPDVVNSHVVIG